MNSSQNAFKSTSSNTLIDTFTNISKETNSDNIYHVSSEIGSLIAQKLDKGVKLYICRNGELVMNQNNVNKISDPIKANR